MERILEEGEQGGRGGGEDERGSEVLVDGWIDILAGYRVM